MNRKADDLISETVRLTPRKTNEFAEVFFRELRPVDLMTPISPNAHVRVSRFAKVDEHGKFECVLTPTGLHTRQPGSATNIGRAIADAAVRVALYRPNDAGYGLIVSDPGERGTTGAKHTMPDGKVYVFNPVAIASVVIEYGGPAIVWIAGMLGDYYLVDNQYMDPKAFPVALVNSDQAIAPGNYII